jgi:serine/threonine protein kinase
MGIKLVDLLEVFHDQGFLHCDIKPDNIMIGDFT